MTHRPEYADPDPHIRRHAACHGRLPAMIMPQGGRTDGHVGGGALTNKDRSHIGQALAICETCPVLAPCRAWAMTERDPAAGLIAGGLTPLDRKNARNDGRKRTA